MLPIPGRAMLPGAEGIGRDEALGNDGRCIFPIPGRWKLGCWACCCIWGRCCICGMLGRCCI
ncbi:MAG: hypothetical protein DWH79_12595 [Planctomycetota bacterium]|nr:MAG: hypothetical protein DWH79_12595 [Planctomycetota bacterium]